VIWNDAVGAWSGEKAIPTGKVPTGIGAPTLFDPVVIGLTVLDPALAE
jgi:hypothetical protein